MDGKAASQVSGGRERLRHLNEGCSLGRLEAAEELAGRGLGGIIDGGHDVDE
jgi:hypothetical protein